MVIGRIDLDAFPDYEDDCFKHENNCAIIEYGEDFGIAGAYEDIYLNLGGEAQAKAFLKYAEKQEHGTFIGDGYTIEF